ncbi:unnamed protein product [Wuchereria bancrofti]|uniref:Uncharacterized protein n=1 Tax=Wuchereria bancrofti TaxID=6293 RepID=A0A3P7FV94_WUCBA|nr:unnamed protein product [Wuchereria bancrofti]
MVPISSMVIRLSNAPRSVLRTEQSNDLLNLKKREITDEQKHSALGAKKIPHVEVQGNVGVL